MAAPPGWTWRASHHAGSLAITPEVTIDPSTAAAEEERASG
ncbi:MAG: hypothetical protein WBM46_04125 [Polyangiales bacterium]